MVARARPRASVRLDPELHFRYRFLFDSEDARRDEASLRRRMGVLGLYTAFNRKQDLTNNINQGHSTAERHTCRRDSSDSRLGPNANGPGGLIFASPEFNRAYLAVVPNQPRAGSTSGSESSESESPRISSLMAPTRAAAPSTLGRTMSTPEADAMFGPT